MILVDSLENFSGWWATMLQPSIWNQLDALSTTQLLFRYEILTFSSAIYPLPKKGPLSYVN